MVIKSKGGRQNKAYGLAARMALMLVAALLVLASLGCYNIRTGRVDVGGSINFKLPAFTQTGPHAVDIFTEMHFQPSYRTQEGPRILPPPDSVPITGKEIEYKSVEEYQTMGDPLGHRFGWRDPQQGAAYLRDELHGMPRLESARRGRRCEDSAVPGECDGREAAQPGECEAQQRGRTDNRARRATTQRTARYTLG